MKNIKFYDGFCLWEDLLGFGKPFVDNNWDITHEDVLKNITRLEYLKKETLNVSSALAYDEKVFALNDGFVRTFDINKNSILGVLLWLENAIISFYRLNKLDLDNNFCGIRGVLAYGKRAVYSSRKSIGLGEYIMTSPEKKEQYNKTKVVNAPSELQMNTAFSKAYIIEDSGKEYNIVGPNLFIDIEVIEKVCEIINSVKTEKITLTSDDEEKGPLFYNFKAELKINKSNNEFIVKACANEIDWICFSVLFDKLVEYNRKDDNGINTCLLVPIKLASCLWSPEKEDIMNYEFDRR